MHYVILTWKVFVCFGVHDVLCPNKRTTIKEPHTIMYLLPDFTVRISFFSVWPWLFHSQPIFIVFCSRLLSHLTLQPGLTQHSIAIVQETPGIWCLMRAVSLFWQATQTVCCYGHGIFRDLVTQICNQHNVVIILNHSPYCTWAKCTWDPLACLEQLNSIVSLIWRKLCSSFIRGANSFINNEIGALLRAIWQAVRLCYAVSLLDLVSICCN